MHNGRRLILGLAAGLAMWGTASSASAHGGIPRAWNVFFEPGNQDHIVLRSDIWGLFQSSDGGTTWEWVCAEAYAGNSLSTERRSVAMLPGGAVVVANSFDGLQISRSGSSCDFEPVPLFDDEVVQDVVLTKSDGSRLHVLTSTGMSTDAGTPFIRARLWESTDGGESWAQVGPDLPSNFSATSVLYAPSDPSRVYISGKSVDDTNNGTVHRSSDGGQTWQTTTIPAGEADGWSARLYAIDPENPDLVFFYMDKSEGGGGDVQPDELWVSSDGGQSFEKAFDATGDLPGFAISPDGQTLIISGPEDGVWRAETSKVATEGQAAFTKVFDGKVWGLSWTASGLHAGTDDFAGGDVPRFMLGVSQDQGETFSPLMEICDTRLVACPADSRTGKVCEPRYSEVGGFEQDWIKGPRCEGEATEPDGGTDPGPNTRGEGGGSGDDGGCAVRGPSSSLGAVLAVLAAVLGGLARRRR